ncbi:MAG: DUF5681 domain-containing protein [Thermomicrobiales bacterium]
MAEEEDKKSLSDDALASARRQVIGATPATPPKDTRFKKGQSGNPRGRPRTVPRDLSLSDQPMLEAALRAGRKKVKVREGERTIEIPFAQAMIEATGVFGLKGNARYAGIWLDYVRNAEITHARDVARKNELWSAYKAQYSELIAQARREGKAEPAIFPHPDDVVIDSIDGPRFVGPMTEEEDKQVKHTIAMCEVLLMQDELDRCSSKRLDGSPVNEPGAAFYSFNRLNNTLPPRLRYSDKAILQAHWRVRRLTKRQLLKQLFAGWRGIGMPLPRGYIFPNMSDLIPPLAAHEEFARRALSGEIEVLAIPQHELAEMIMAHLDRRVPEIRRTIRQVLDTRRVA